MQLAVDRHLVICRLRHSDWRRATCLISGAVSVMPPYGRCSHAGAPPHILGRAALDGAHSPARHAGAPGRGRPRGVRDGGGGLSGPPRPEAPRQLGGSWAELPNHYPSSFARWRAKLASIEASTSSDGQGSTPRARISPVTSTGRPEFESSGIWFSFPPMQTGIVRPALGQAGDHIARVA